MSGTKDLIFLDPIFQNKIWGGRSLQTKFGFAIPEGPVGEGWAISAHPSGDCRVKGGVFHGQKLSQVYAEHPEVFGNLDYSEFPLLVKFIDAAQDLSIQVHPDDAYAQEREGQTFGKRECWYILDAAPDATIVVGQKAHNPQEFLASVKQGKWGELLNEIPIQKGDFFQIDPGTVHAIKAGTLVLETQQSSDITYRVYDYDRIQPDGTLRELHLEKSLEVIDFEAEAPASPYHPELEDDVACELISCPNYTVDVVKIVGSFATEGSWPFICVTVIEGSGKAGTHFVSKGDSFIIPSGMDGVVFEGNMTCVMSHLSC